MNMRSGRMMLGTCALATALATPAHSESVDETLAAEPNGLVDIENLAGSVRVVGWDREEIQVTGRLGRQVERLDFEVDGDRAVVHVVLPRRVRNVDETDLEIHVPRGSRLDVQTVSAHIDVRDVEGRVDLESVSGEIVLSGNCEMVRAESVSGDIELDADTGDVRLQTVSGRVDVIRAHGEIEAASVSGDVDIRGSASFTQAAFSSVSGDVLFEGAIEGRGDFEFESHSGDVVLRVAGELNAEIEVSTFSGSIESDFADGDRRSRRRFAPGDELSITVGDGEARITIDTFSGDVEIRSAEDR
jgi:DUF4097 and DUF4098 domain-containing protein YvlB